ncbi:hypothetical protein AwEntero_16060 [Enterobacterales bacterium]|nr:hypothetical protein AwEntero_16060 [Enterobacterales bacterium]
MSLADRLAEQKIAEAIKNGDLNNLPGAGKPLQLDDDNAVPDKLRLAYRILKNAGYLPPELQDRKEALELKDMLDVLTPGVLEYHSTSKRLRVLELRLQQAGVNTDFLNAEYKIRMVEKFGGN